jgi:hypothetical protein
MSIRQTVKSTPNAALLTISLYLRAHRAAHACSDIVRFRTMRSARKSSNRVPVFARRDEQDSAVNEIGCDKLRASCCASPEWQLAIPLHNLIIMLTRLDQVQDAVDAMPGSSEPVISSSTRFHHQLRRPAGTRSGSGSDLRHGIPCGSEFSMRSNARLEQVAEAGGGSWSTE